MAQGQSPTAMQALFAALQANHEEIHRHITSIHSTQIHEKSLLEMEAERSAYMAETASKQRAEDDELLSKYAEEDESLRSTRAIEDDAVRKRRSDEDAALLEWRHKHNASKLKRREESDKAFHDLMDGEVGKLKEDIASKLKNGQSELGDLLDKRKFINQEIDNEMNKIYTIREVVTRQQQDPIATLEVTSDTPDATRETAHVTQKTPIKYNYLKMLKHEDFPLPQPLDMVDAEEDSMKDLESPPDEKDVQAAVSVQALSIEPIVAETRTTTDDMSATEDLDVTGDVTTADIEPDMPVDLDQVAEIDNKNTAEAPASPGLHLNDGELTRNETASNVDHMRPITSAALDEDLTPMSAIESQPESKLESELEAGNASQPDTDLAATKHASPTIIANAEPSPVGPPIVEADFRVVEHEKQELAASQEMDSISEAIVLTGIEGGEELLVAKELGSSSIADSTASVAEGDLYIPREIVSTPVDATSNVEGPDEAFEPREIISIPAPFIPAEEEFVPREILATPIASTVELSEEEVMIPKELVPGPVSPIAQHETFVPREITSTFPDITSNKVDEGKEVYEPKAITSTPSTTSPEEQEFIPKEIVSHLIATVPEEVVLDEAPMIPKEIASTPVAPATPAPAPVKTRFGLLNSFFGRKSAEPLVPAPVPVVQPAEDATTVSEPAVRVVDEVEKGVMGEAELVVRNLDEPVITNGVSPEEVGIHEEEEEEELIVKDLDEQALTNGTLPEKVDLPDKEEEFIVRDLDSPMPVVPAIPGADVVAMEVESVGEDTKPAASAEILPDKAINSENESADAFVVKDLDSSPAVKAQSIPDEAVILDETDLNFHDPNPIDERQTSLVDEDLEAQPEEEPTIGKNMDDMRSVDGSAADDIVIAVVENTTPSLNNETAEKRSKELIMSGSDDVNGHIDTPAYTSVASPDVESMTESGDEAEDDIVVKSFDEANVQDSVPTAADISTSDNIPQDHEHDGLAIAEGYQPRHVGPEEVEFVVRDLNALESTIHEVDSALPVENSLSQSSAEQSQVVAVDAKISSEVSDIQHARISNDDDDAMATRELELDTEAINTVVSNEQESASPSGINHDITTDNSGADDSHIAHDDSNTPRLSGLEESESDDVFKNTDRTDSPLERSIKESKETSITIEHDEHDDAWVEAVHDANNQSASRVTGFEAHSVLEVPAKDVKIVDMPAIFDDVACDTALLMSSTNRSPEEAMSGNNAHENSVELSEGPEQSAMLATDATSLAMREDEVTSDNDGLTASQDQNEEVESDGRSAEVVQSSISGLSIPEVGLTNSMPLYEHEVEHAQPTSRREPLEEDSITTVSRSPDEPIETKADNEIEVDLPHSVDTSTIDTTTTEARIDTNNSDSNGNTESPMIKPDNTIAINRADVVSERELLPPIMQEEAEDEEQELKPSNGPKETEVVSSEDVVNANSGVLLSEKSPQLSGVVDMPQSHEVHDDTTKANIVEAQDHDTAQISPSSHANGHHDVASVSEASARHIQDVMSDDDDADSTISTKADVMHDPKRAIAAKEEDEGEPTIDKSYGILQNDLLAMPEHPDPDNAKSVDESAATPEEAHERPSLTSAISGSPSDFADSHGTHGSTDPPAVYRPNLETMDTSDRIVVQHQIDLDDIANVDHDDDDDVDITNGSSGSVDVFETAYLGEAETAATEFPGLTVTIGEQANSGENSAMPLTPIQPAHAIPGTMTVREAVMTANTERHLNVEVVEDDLKPDLPDAHVVVAMHDTVAGQASIAQNKDESWMLAEKATYDAGSQEEGATDVQENEATSHSPTVPQGSDYTISKQESETSHLNVVASANSYTPTQIYNKSIDEDNDHDHLDNNGQPEYENGPHDNVIPSDKAQNDHFRMPVQETEIYDTSSSSSHVPDQVGSTMDYLRQNEGTSHDSSGEDDVSEQDVSSEVQHQLHEDSTDGERDVSDHDGLAQNRRSDIKSEYHDHNSESLNISNEKNQQGLHMATNGHAQEELDHTNNAHVQSTTDVTSNNDGEHAPLDNDDVDPPLTPRTQAQIEHDEYQSFLLNAQELIEIEKLSGSPSSRIRRSDLPAIDTEHVVHDDSHLREGDSPDLSRPVSSASSIVSTDTVDRCPSLVPSSSGSTSAVNKRRSLFGSVAMFGTSVRASLISSKSSQDFTPPVEEEDDVGELTPRPTMTHFRQASEGYRPDPKPPGYFTHNRWNSGYDYVDSRNHSRDIMIPEVPTIPEQYYANEPDPTTPRQDKEYEAAVHRMSSLEQLQSGSLPASNAPISTIHADHTDADSILDAYGTDRDESIDSMSQASLSSTPPQPLSPVLSTMPSPAPRIRSSTTISRPEDLYPPPNSSPSRTGYPSSTSSSPKSKGPLLPPPPITSSISIAERRSRFEAATAAAAAKNASNKMVNMRPPRPLSRYSLSSSPGAYGSREGSEERPAYAKRPE